MPDVFGLSFDCLSQSCLRYHLRRRASLGCIDHCALHRVEKGPPHLFAIRTLLSQVGFEPVTLCSRSKDVCKSSVDLLRMPAPSTLMALDPFPCHVFQLARIEEYPQELHKPAKLC